MPALIVVYSKTGTARAVADRLSARLPGAQVAPIVCGRYAGTGGLTYARAAVDAALDLSAPVTQPVSTTGCDPVILVCPVWAGRPAVPMLSWLRSDRPTLPGRIGVVLVSGAGGAQGAAFDRLRTALPIREAARLSLSEREVRAGGAEERVAAFLAALEG
jgi:hypothetical protein